MNGTWSCVLHYVEITGNVKILSKRYSVTSLVPQTVKNQPARQDTQVQSLGWEDPLEQGMATHANDITYMWNQKNNTNELIYKTEIDLQT